MTRDFFDANVIIAVEIEYEAGGRTWHTMKSSEVKAFCDNLSEDEYVSDIDYCTKQESQEIRDFLDSCYDEWFHTKHDFKSLDELINSKFEAPSKRVWKEEEIRELIQTNDKVLYGALKKLYAQQTADEKQAGNTKEKNSKGFNGYDARFLTSVAEFLIKNGFLTYKQKLVTRKKLIKYNKQLTRLANA